LSCLLNYEIITNPAYTHSVGGASIVLLSGIRRRL